MELIQSHPIIETNAQSMEDKILMGLLDLLYTLLTYDLSLKSQYGPILIPDLFHACLFDIPTLDHKGNPPKCKTSASRRTAFRVLTELIRNCSANMKLLCIKLIEYHAKQSYKKQWQYSPQNYDKSPCGYWSTNSVNSTTNSTLNPIL
jgi:hypothetical protein